MEINNSEILASVFPAVAESMTFMFADPVAPTDMPSDAAEYVQTSMGFVGPVRGSLTLAVPSDKCSLIASNILGLDPNDPAVTERAHDAIKELLNVTCGQVLTAMAGDNPIFDLTVPTIRMLTSDEWQAFVVSDGSVTFMMDDSPVALQLTVGDQPAV
jgi:CheY-specific phosphatase CheX